MKRRMLLAGVMLVAAGVLVVGWGAAPVEAAAKRMPSPEGFDRALTEFKGQLAAFSRAADEHGRKAGGEIKGELKRGAAGELKIEDKTAPRTSGPGGDANALIGLLRKSYDRMWAEFGRLAASAEHKGEYKEYKELKFWQPQAAGNLRTKLQGLDRAIQNAEKSAGSPQGINWGDHAASLNSSFQGVEQARGDLLPAVRQ